MRHSAHSMELPRWAPPLVVALAAGLCLWLGLRTVMTLLAAGDAPTASLSGLPITDAASAPAPTLAQWHLFGSALPTQDARSAANAPETTLDLRLTGLFADTDPAHGIALIADGSGNQAAYKAGAVLPGGARLKSVYVDHVLLVSNGRDETLRLPRELANEGPARSASAPAQPGGLAMAPVNVAGLETVDWQAVQRQAQGDPAALARHINILPVIENGAVVGMRLGGAQSAMLSRIGLRPDDVVTAVNGISVKDVGRARQVIEAVRDADRVSVTVRRNGREETLDVSLR